MNIQRKRDFLISLAYWAVVAAGLYLGFAYLLPVSVPFLIGLLVACVVVWISRKIHLPGKLPRIILAVLVYGVIALLITLLAALAIDGIMGLILWLPQVYDKKILPFVVFCYDWCIDNIKHIDPNLTTPLLSLQESLLSAVKDLISHLSGYAMNIVSGVATGVPSLIISLLTMIFSTIFVVGDYEKILEFTSEHMPEKLKNILSKVRTYLTETLFVVIRSYVLIMLLTFTELSILFYAFGIKNAVVKAAAIAVMDILPILGTGGVLIPWATVSLVVGYTGLGIRLFVIYAIVTVVRNYVEPKIVGTQLGLHPIITLVSMFIGLRLFGFWGLFGLPVGISFLWKEKLVRESKLAGAPKTE